MLFGVQESLVSREDPEPLTMAILFFFLRDVGDSERDGGIDQVRDHVDLADIVPLACLGDCYLVAVLVIRDDHFDGFAENRAAEIFNGHFYGSHRAVAGFMGELARHVGHHADLDDIVRDFRLA